MKIQLYFFTVILLVVLDQLTKLAAYEYLKLNSIIINDFFSLTLAQNHGAAFSFLADQDGWQRYFLSGISAIVSIIISVWMFKTPLKYKAKLLSLTLILSGAIGNMTDRITNGFVIDFLDFHYSTWHFPIFNIADILISIGAIFLIIVDWKNNSKLT